jgi:hypothetical protein
VAYQVVQVGSTTKTQSLGNLSDGILLLDDHDSQTYIGPMSAGSYSVISNNRGDGIHIVNSSNFTIENNTVGLSFPVGSGQTQTAMGNASDGIFLDTVAGSSTQPLSVMGNDVAGNREDGIHAAGSANVPTYLSIVGNKVGTDATGTMSFGNGSDGIFLDTVSSSSIGGTASGAGNVIAENGADGIDLLDSSEIRDKSGNLVPGSGVGIIGNMIGTGITGTERLGNAGSGIYVNESSWVTIGGLTSTPGAAPGNVISWNQVYGVALSAIAGTTSASNVVEGNSVFGNAVSGVLINNASSNTIGGSVQGSNNVISANQLYGIELNADPAQRTASTQNMIWGNFIGTDSTGRTPMGNGSDGIFLNNAASNQIGGIGSLEGNVISGNAGNGVHIFGGGSSSNQLLNNEIGVDPTGSIPVPNLANGVLIDNAGPNIIGGTTAGQRNIISGNHQSGVVIVSSTGAGSTIVEGNYIGTDWTGSFAIGNSGNGVFIYGSSKNTIGGATAAPGTAPGNVISGNAQAGVAIFSPAPGALANWNLVAGNEIGTNAAGSSATGTDGKPLGNKSDGVDIFSGQFNTIGQAGMVGSRNVISGNGGNGILITKLSNIDALSNLINQNYIGTDRTGTSALSNVQNGVLVQNAYGNTIGTPSSGSIQNVEAPTTPSNVISSNGASGVAFSVLAENGMPGNTVQGNFIGVSEDGMVGLGNGFAGVFVDNLGGFSSNEQIGGTGAGTGNIIAGSSAGYGVDIVGPVTDATPANNHVQGNLIGLAIDGKTPIGNSIGVYLQNSWGNTIGGAAGNVVSANSQAGVELTGLYSTRNVIQGNEIGTTIDGGGRPGTALSVAVPTKDNTSPLQTYGVYITTPSPTFDSKNKAPNNQILDNLISGNLMGINITGVGSGIGTGQGVPFGRDLIAGNMIGTAWSGNAANPNFEYGVYIDNSAGNTVGGTGTGAGNLISANGVDGVEIIGGTPQTTAAPSKSGAPAARNVIIGNTIGYNSAGAPGFTAGGGASITVPDGPLVTLGQQLYGVVVIGSSSNIIGSKKQGNLIGGNVSTGVYITVQDFNGNVYSTPTNNTVSFNTIVNNGQYGVYRFESPRNSVARIKFGGNRINLADYLKNVGVNTLPAPKSRYPYKVHSKPAKASHTRHPKVQVHKHGHGKVSTPARPRIPALFHHGVKTIRIEHVPARRHR